MYRPANHKEVAIQMGWIASGSFGRVGLYQSLHTDLAGGVPMMGVVNTHELIILDFGHR